MSSPKANIICLLKILWDYSDGDNILSMKDIKSKMIQLTTEISTAVLSLTVVMR